MTVARFAAAAIAGLLATAAAAHADQWNDQTLLTINKPMIVPGATLTPGTYSFELTDIDSTRNVVTIYRQPEHTLVASTAAVPMKRSKATGDIVLTIEPTEPGTPPAIKGWFYPGSVYGHEFVYPEAQARVIAQRTKTLV